MRILIWLLRGFLFFALFAFSLNNQQNARINWFFGYTWEAPMVIIVLAAVVLGVAVGVLGMLPGWIRRRAVARPEAPEPEAAIVSPIARPTNPDTPPIPDGL